VKTNTAVKIMSFLALLIGISVAQVKNVAVVETEVDEHSGASAKLNKAEVRQITAVLRRAAVGNLPRGKYNIMTSETVQAQGSAVLEACSDENCVITLGAKIGADYIVRGIISKFGKSLTVSVEMYETEDGNLVASSDLVRSETTAELLDKTAASSANMYKTFMSTQSSIPEKTPPQQLTVAEPPSPPPVPHVSAEKAPSPQPEPPPKQPTVAAQVSPPPTPKESVEKAPTPQPAPPPKQPAVAVAAQASPSPVPAPQVSKEKAPVTQPAPPPPQPIVAKPVSPAPAPQVSTQKKAPPPQQPAVTVPQPSEMFTDSRDGNQYRTTRIGGRKWMARNLNYQPQTGKSWCYDNDSSNCDKYGRLYDWNTARTVCPSGWRLPSNEEWGNLAESVADTGKSGGVGKAGKKLKAKKGWNSDGNGTDDYKFSALPGGGRSVDGGFNNVGYYGYWWTATESERRYAYYRNIHYYGGSVGKSSDVKSDGFSVRCVEGN